MLLFLLTESKQQLSPWTDDYLKVKFLFKSIAIFLFSRACPGKRSSGNNSMGTLKYYPFLLVAVAMLL